MIKVNFNPFGRWLYDFWKQKEQDFIEYIGLKYYFNQYKRDKLLNICKVVKSLNQFKLEDLREIQELSIPFVQTNGISVTELRERKSPVSYDTFVTYLANICDGKFTKEQIKQTIEYGYN